MIKQIKQFDEYDEMALRMFFHKCFDIIGIIAIIWLVLHFVSLI